MQHLANDIPAAVTQLLSDTDRLVKWSDDKLALRLLTAERAYLQSVANGLRLVLQAIDRQQTSVSNGFEHWKIDHLSASSLNFWRSSPGVWVRRYLFQQKEEDKPAVLRGRAVEAGGVHYLRTGDMDASVGVALGEYTELMQGEINDASIKQATLIGPMVRKFEFWKPPSTLNAVQIRIEHWLPGVPVPFIGFIDLSFDGIDVDIKSTETLPSKPRPDHVRQVSLYRAARHRGGGVLYVTPSRHAFYEISDADTERCIAEMTHEAMQLGEFLGLVKTRKQAACLPIDWDDYRAPKRVPIEHLLDAG
jgi:hypothetical protein